MTLVVETIPLRRGEITIYDNRDYILLEGDPASPDATSTYYRAGYGPEEYQLLVDRIVTNYETQAALRAARGTSGISSARAAVRGVSTEDEDGVPYHMRSSASLFRSDRRLADPRHAEEERTRRRRHALAMRLGTELGHLHGHLSFLITTQAGEPRYTPMFMAGDGRPSHSQMRPSELQQAILAGLVVEGSSGPFLADVRRGVRNDIVDALAEELPGFEEQYGNVYASAVETAWNGVLLDLVLTVIDILEEIITLGASAVLSMVRRSLTTSAGVLRRSVVHREARALIGSGEEMAERRARGTADDVLEPDAVISSSDVPVDAIDASPGARARGRSRTEHGPPRAEGLEEESAGLARRSAEGTGRGTDEAVEPDSLRLGSGAPDLESSRPVPRLVASTELSYHGPLASGARETALREAFGAERLTRLLAGFGLLDEHLPGAIRRVMRRTNAGRGLVPAAADATLARLRRRLRRIIPARAPLSPDSLSATARRRAIEILIQARVAARRRWNVLRNRLWRQLYREEEVRAVLRQMESDGLIALPPGFPNCDGPPRALAANRDGVIWLRTNEGVPAAQIGRELGLSATAVEGRLVEIRRNIAAGRPAPPLTSELPLNLDHITPIQLNPWNFFHPNNLRVLNASFNDTWLRIYQLRSAFPMTDDNLEAWVRAFELW